MNVFVTGASGYIGGAIAIRLIAAGHAVAGLIRDRAKADALAKLGVRPVVGGLDDEAVLVREVAAADAVVNAASSDHRGAVTALVQGLAGSGKPFLHTSGSSILADRAGGEPSDVVFTEDALPEPPPERTARVAIDRLVLDLAGRGVRSAVICPTLIYGRGRGLNPHSSQLPALAQQARKSGVVRHVGRGLNVWSNVHVDDLAELYLLALEWAEPGTFLFAENGEASFGEMCAALATSLALDGPRPWPLDDAIHEWGYEKAVLSLGSNSRARGLRAKALGWRPRHRSVLDWIRSDLDV